MAISFMGREQAEDGGHGNMEENIYYEDILASFI